ncbi:uncharacterized protein [Diadema antillarum]|uniref:uncharacterized protein n=1 Tax=Diadema antillarum TaxID=105358 RepID=UPI003A8B57D8
MEWGPLGGWLTYLLPSGSSCILSRLQPSRLRLATGPGVSGRETYRGWRGSPSSGRNTRKMKTKALTLASWNVRTLLDDTKANRPERRTTLVARELARYNVDIAALSETRLAERGQLTEIGGGYTFFWSGRSSKERREAGVGFAVKSIHVQKLASIPLGLNDRLMSMHLPLGKKRSATVISAYAPTMTNPDEVKDKFYEELDSLIASSKSEKLIILGDFNARVGADYHAWHNVVGKHGIGNCNSNGHLLLRFCSSHNLVITNTMFRLPTRNKTSWMHPRSKHWHLIDYVIVRARDRQDVRVTKAMCDPKKLQEHMHNHLADLQLNQSSIEDQWATFRDAVHSVALECLGPATRHHQDWFDENDAEIQELLDTKHNLLRLHQNDPSSMAKKAAFTKARSKVQAKLRHMKDSWLSAKADEIQSFTDRNDMKNFYDALKAVYGPKPSGSSPILSADGSTLLTEKKLILERWAEHFNSVLNQPAQINNEAINRLPQVPTSLIPFKLTKLYQSMWSKEQLPQEFRDATVVHIYKRKGNRQACDNHRGISLLSIAGKILARVLLNRLLEHLEQGHLPESQCGFRAGRGTSDRIFAARQLQEKCIEQHRDLYTTFVDLTKAFDTLSLTNGVKQGCVLAPTLFSMTFSAMLSDVFKDCEPDGINIRYRSDGKLFNLRRLKVITKVKETVIRDFSFADDCALNANGEDEMQLQMDRFSSDCDNFGLTISTKKTEVMFQPAPGSQYHEPQIQVNGQTLQAAKTFTYLGSTLSNCVTIDAELNNRISKASIPDTEELTRTGIPSIITKIRKAQVRWAGHVTRMSDDRIPKKLFYGELADGNKRKVGGQKKRFKDNLKFYLKDFSINTASWETLAADRPSWRHAIAVGARRAEEQRVKQAEHKRQMRKARAANPSSVAPTHFCPTCGRGFLAQIGLISHLRTHRAN